MMNKAQIGYLKRSIERHVKLHFQKDAIDAYLQADIRWIRWNEIGLEENLLPNTIIIPIVEDHQPQPINPWTIDFRDTKITLWGHLPKPSNDWEEINDQRLWYKNAKGAYLISWNLASILFELLTLNEEISSMHRDKHKRFIGNMSPRSKEDLLTVPIFNNSVALLVDRCMKNYYQNSYDTKRFVKPINICLSHDLDQLRGDDFWTQMSRITRIISPVFKLKMPDLSQIAYFFENLFYPRKHFMDELLSMIKLESDYGFRSSQYLLSGKKGRFGARTSDKYIKQYLSEIPSGWPIGMHYNYDTYLDEASFIKQKANLESITNSVIKSGRAHYLRLDPELSFEFWSKLSIKYDESLGYPDRVGYRAGIAGPFYPYDYSQQKELPILTIPLVAMDSCFQSNFGVSSVNEIEKMVTHLSIVGGSFTLLFHPGRYNNPEYEDTRLIYDELLEVFHRYKAKCLLPNEFFE